MVVVARIVQTGFALIGLLSGFNGGVLSGLVEGLPHQIHAQVGQRLAGRVGVWLHLFSLRGVSVLLAIQ